MSNCRVSRMLLNKEEADEKNFDDDSKISCINSINLLKSFCIITVMLYWIAILLLLYANYTKSCRCNSTNLTNIHQFDITLQSNNSNDKIDRDNIESDLFSKYLSDLERTRNSTLFYLKSCIIDAIGINKIPKLFVYQLENWYATLLDPYKDVCTFYKNYNVINNCISPQFDIIGNNILLLINKTIQLCPSI